MRHLPARPPTPGLLALAPLALTAGAVALATARHDPGESLAGATPLGGVAGLAAGWSLVLAALAPWARYRRLRFPLLLGAAGCAWFLPEWSSPGAADGLV